MRAALTATAACGAASVGTRRPIILALTWFVATAIAAILVAATLPTNSVVVAPLASHLQLLSYHGRSPSPGKSMLRARVWRSRYASLDYSKARRWSMNSVGRGGHAIGFVAIC